VTIDVGQPNSTMLDKRNEERLHVSPTTTSFVFPTNCFSIFFLFLAVGKEVEEHRDILWEEVGCVGVTRPAL
jgi:hypothetical protein